MQGLCWDNHFHWSVSGYTTTAYFTIIPAVSTKTKSSTWNTVLDKKRKLCSNQMQHQQFVPRFTSHMHTDSFCFPYALMSLRRAILTRPPVGKKMQRGAPSCCLLSTTWKGIIGFSFETSNLFCVDEVCLPTTAKTSRAKKENYFPPLMICPWIWK